MEIIQADVPALSGTSPYRTAECRLRFGTVRAALCMSVIFDCQRSWDPPGLTGHADSPIKGVCEVLSWR